MADQSLAFRSFGSSGILLTPIARNRTSDLSVFVDIKHRFKPMVQFGIICVIFSSDQLCRTIPDPLQGQECSRAIEFISPSSRLSALACILPIGSLVTC